MNKNTICRLTAFTMALSVLCGSAVSCGSGKSNDKSDTSKSSNSQTKKTASNEAEQAKANLAASMKAVPVDLEFECEHISSMIRLADSDTVLIAATVKEKSIVDKVKEKSESKKEEDEKTEEESSEKEEGSEKEESSSDESVKEESSEKEDSSEKEESSSDESVKEESSDKEEESEKKETSDKEGEKDSADSETEAEDDEEASEDKLPEENYVQKIFITDTSLTEISELKINGIDDGVIQLIAAPDGTAIAFQTIEDYGDMELPDEDDEDFDYEALNEARKTTYKFINFDANGKVITNTEIEGFDEYISSENIYADNLIPFGKDKFILNTNDYNTGESATVVIDLNGKIIDKLETDDFQWIMGASETSDGRFVIAGSSMMGMKLKFFNTDTMKAEGTEIEPNDTSMYNIFSLFKGDGDYLVYAVTMTAIYGIKEDGTCDEKINFADCDINTNGYTGLIPLDNGEYIAYNYSYEEGGCSFYRLVARAEGELDNTKIVTIGTLFDDSQVSGMISKFNKEHDGIRIKAVNYSKYDDYDMDTETINNTSARQLKMDIVAGKAPDMIVTYDRSVIASLAGKNVFTDLYGLMDDDLKKEDILDNVINAGEINGKLLSLSPTFYVQTLACKKKYCDKENWTFEDLKKTYESLPEGMGLCSIDSNEAVLQLVLPSLASCVDYTTSTCNFDTPEFKAMVEFCAQFPDTEELIDYKNASNEELMEFYNDIENKFMEDKALLSDIYIGEFRDYKEAVMHTFNDEVTLVGTPSEDGNGAHLSFSDSFAILESSDAKEECWEFIKSFFTEEAYKDAYQFPTVKKEFDKAVDNATKKRTYTDEDGVEHEIDDTYFINGKEIKLDPLTEEEKDYIVNYIKNIKYAAPDLSDEIYEIGNECLKYYFKGEKSLDEAIALLQSKVSIFLSEQS